MTRTTLLSLVLAACGGSAEQHRADAEPSATAEVPAAAPASEPAQPSATQASDPVAKPKVPKPSARDEELVRAGREALDRGDGQAAVRAFEEALAGGSKAYLVDWSVREELPSAYVVAGDLDHAALRADELLEGASRAVALRLRETRADIECARGDVEAALARYRALLSDVSDRRRWRDPGHHLDYTFFLEVSAKLRLLGRRLPELEPEWIVGADKFDLDGRVAVLSYLSPYRPDSGQSPVLRRIAALPGSPAVAAVVATDADQHVPGPFEIPKEKWEKPKLNPRQCSAAWRERTGASVPVLGVGPQKMPEDCTLFRYHAVVDRDRRVVYVGTQSDPGGRIEEAMVRRLLAR